MKITCNLEILRQATEEYFYAEEEYRKSVKTWKQSGRKKKNAEEHENCVKLCIQAQEKWNTVEMICQMVDICSNDIIPIMKAIRRWEEHSGKWDRNIHFCYVDEESEENLMKLIKKIPFRNKHQRVLPEHRTENLSLTINADPERLTSGRKGVRI